ncbi:NAD(P)H dehydrogenase [Verticiella sediminum]|uniref:FMN dependent NADH:quinone oxidoreductase n=1 Tax=Verticiella sediminum TaxID=1247510 RepID=A0A556AYC0_9BURK|nr:NAD(P)H-dependent oxidoreductase [Verticiella sediminum]TSH97927.1 NAD(P)H dehydrogenase [Verticiella sediminum]
MANLLIVDASARPGLGGIDAHGAYSRRLTHHFASRWRLRRPGDVIVHREVGLTPPAAVTHDWIAAAYTPVAQRTPAMRAALRESDALAAELAQADLLVIGSPLYNFGMPAGLKAWVDNVVRIGVTMDFVPERADPYVPLLAPRRIRAASLVARGGHGMDPGGEHAAMNHLESSLTTALGFIGVTDFAHVAVEHQEFGGQALDASLHRALASVDALAQRWDAELRCALEAVPACA